MASDQEHWSERGTTPARIEAALRDLLAQRHREDESFVTGRVLNLVVVVDRDFRGEVENRLSKLGRYHASRTIVCALHEDRTELDAVATIGVDEDAGGGVASEHVDIEIGRHHLCSLASIVDPVIVSDVATLVWSPHGHHEALDALRGLAQVVLVDSVTDPDPAEAFALAARSLERAHVVDLAWLRSAPWRERIAGAFDPQPWRRALGTISTVSVKHHPDSEAAGLLFVGWLASRLGWRTAPLSATRGGGGLTGRCSARRQDVQIRLEPDPELSAPGLGGVQVETADGGRVSLDRSPGGLKATRRDRKGHESSYKVLGASRGEAGILGEGVRQALLRDPIYRPALESARGLVR